MIWTLDTGKVSKVHLRVGGSVGPWPNWLAGRVLSISNGPVKAWQKMEEQTVLTVECHCASWVKSAPTSAVSEAELYSTHFLRSPELNLLKLPLPVQTEGKMQWGINTRFQSCILCLSTDRSHDAWWCSHANHCGGQRKTGFKSSLVSHRTQPAYDHQHEYEVPSEAPGATSMAPFTEDTGPMYATLTTPF